MKMVVTFVLVVDTAEDLDPCFPAYPSNGPAACEEWFNNDVVPELAEKIANELGSMPSVAVAWPVTASSSSIVGYSLDDFEQQRRKERFYLKRWRRKPGVPRSAVQPPPDSSTLPKETTKTT